MASTKFIGKFGKCPSLGVAATFTDFDAFTNCSVHCRSYMRLFSDYCEKSECIDKFTAGTFRHLVDLVFDIEVGISDHTGTLMCRLTGKHAETLLRCTVEEFLAMADEDKAALKWQHLLERCAIKLVVKRKSAELSKHMITIVDCVLANSDEVAERISIY
jgi:meiosis-specific with OB domain-containing protein